MHSFHNIDGLPTSTRSDVFVNSFAPKDLSKKENILETTKPPPTPTLMIESPSLPSAIRKTEVVLPTLSLPPIPSVDNAPTDFDRRATATTDDTICEDVMESWTISLDQLAGFMQT